MAGAVLAAGRSTRMGRPKALLRVGSESFLERAIRLLTSAGCAPVVAVVPPAEELPEASAVAAEAGARVVPNPDRESDPVDSIRRAIDAVGDVEAVTILPVDHPRVAATTVCSVVDAYRETRAPIVRPSFEERAGHPIVIDHTLWGALREQALARGLRSLVDANLDRVLHVTVSDPGIRIDIDTPELYGREVKGR